MQVCCDAQGLARTVSTQKLHHINSVHVFVGLCGRGRQRKREKKRGLKIGENKEKERKNGKNVERSREDNAKHDRNKIK